MYACVSNQSSVLCGVFPRGSHRAHVSTASHTKPKKSFADLALCCEPGMQLFIVGARLCWQVDCAGTGSERGSQILRGKAELLLGLSGF